MCWYVAYCDGWRLDVPIQSPTDKAAATGMVARLRSVGYTVEEVGEVEDSDEVLSRDLRPVAD